MLIVGTRIIIDVDRGNTLYDWNGEEGEIVNITEDLFGHAIYDVDIDGNPLLVFESEMRIKKGVK